MMFEDAFNANEYAFASVTIDGDITAVNQKFEALTGYSEEQLKLLTFREITPEKWLCYENRHLMNGVFKQGASHYCKEYIHANGDIFPVALDVYLLRDSGGEVTGMWAKVWPIDSSQLPDESEL